MQRRFIPLVRFRIATLFWLAVVVAAFFVGRQSDEIGARLSQLWQTLWPSAGSYRLVNQSDGSLLFISKFRVSGVTYKGPQICHPTGVGSNQVKIAAQQDGNTQVICWQYDKATKKTDLVTIDLVIVNGRIKATDLTAKQSTDAVR